MSEVVEIFRHFSCGAALMFFVMQAGILLRSKDQNRIKKLLFLLMLFWIFLEIKDALTFIGAIADNPEVMMVISSMDSWAVPLCWLFMFEIVSPGWVTIRRAAVTSFPFLVFTALLVVFPLEILYDCFMIISLLVGLVGLGIIYFASSEYDNYIKRNFSYLDNIGLLWVRRIVIIFAFFILIWAVTYLYPTSIGYTLFYYVTIFAWFMILRKAIAHRIVPGPKLIGPFTLRQSESQEEEEEKMQESLNLQDKYAFASVLESVVEGDKLYLNPELNARDVAQAVGTNRTYLSDYINNQLGTTFYDYINSFRVQRAIEMLSTEDDNLLEVVAQQSGFNSLSTFRRYFVKATGMPPSEYRNRIKE